MSNDSLRRMIAAVSRDLRAARKANDRPLITELVWELSHFRAIAADRQGI